MDRQRVRQWSLGGVLLLLLVIWWRSGTSDRQLIRQLQSQEATDRFAAIRGLEESGSQRANKAISERVQDPEPKVAGRAVLALGNIGGPANITLLEKGLSDSRPAVREASAVALGRCDPQVPIVAAGLIKLLNEDDTAAVRAAAATALGTRKVRDAVPALIEALSDESPDVRSRAGAAIQQISGRAFGFPVYAPPEAREVVIQNIEDWWKQAQATGSSPK
jgi:HEAT repeat protein